MYITIDDFLGFRTWLPLMFPAPHAMGGVPVDDIGEVTHQEGGTRLNDWLVWSVVLDV